MKGSADVETMAPATLSFYARACGWTLARAHARSGDPIAIAAYLGEGDQFDRAITDFAGRYADQNERDYTPTGEGRTPRPRIADGITRDAGWLQPAATPERPIQPQTDEHHHHQHDRVPEGHSSSGRCRKFIP